MSLSTCPSGKDFQRLVRGELDPGAVETVLTHLSMCRRCTEAVRWLIEAEWPDGVAVTARLGPDNDARILVAQLRSRLADATHTGAYQSTNMIDSPHTRNVTPSPPQPKKGDSIPDTHPTGIKKPDYLKVLAPAQANGELGRLGPYRVLKVLGAGGMGVVFRGEDVSLRRQVAIKALLPNLVSDPDSSLRFMREAQLMASLKHDNIITIYQVGEEQGVPYFSMELLEGQPLDDRLKNGPPLPLAESLRIVREVALGLGAAHRRGLIHRDIKPANLWLEADTNRVKILDFGLARATKGDLTITEAGTVMGTPAYMSPEQARGEKVDHRSDLFSLGCVLYQLCTGKMPFRGSDTMSTLLAIVNDEPQHPLQLVPALPQGLGNLILRLLAKRADARPESAQQVAEAIDQLSRNVVINPNLSMPPTSERITSASVLRTPSAPYHAPVQPSHFKYLPFLIVFLLGILGGVGYLYGKQTMLYFANKGEVTLLTSPGDTLSVAITDRAGKRLAEQSEPRFELPMGEYILEITSSGSDGQFRSFSRPLSLAKGARQRIDITVVPPIRTLRTLKHGVPIHSLVATPSGELIASGGADGSVKVWEQGANEPRILIPPHTGEKSRAVEALAIEKTGKYLAVGFYTGEVELWDVNAPRATAPLWAKKLKGEVSRITSLAFSSDGRWIAGANWPEGALIWDVALGNLAKMAPILPEQRVNCLAFSNDSKRLLLGTEGGDLSEWTVPEGTKRSSYPAKHQYPVMAVAYAPNGQLVASADFKKRVRIREPQVGALRQSLEGASHGLSFTPDARCLAGTDFDGTLNVWDVEKLDVAFMQREIGHRVIFTNEGKQLITAGLKGVIVVWDVAELTRSAGGRTP